jgi:hypothetical protein
MKQWGIIFSFGILVLATACEYNLTGENYIEKTPPAEYVEIDLGTLTPGDTILLLHPMYFTFKFDLKEKKLYKGIFTLNDQKWEINNTSGSIILDPKLIPQGIHTLELELVFSSETGSIADIVNAEGYIGRFEWILAVGNSSIMFEMSHYFNEDGYLTITWPRCNQPNFESYILRRVQDYSSSYYTINDRNTTQFIDSCFYGYQVFYHLQKTFTNHSTTLDTYLDAYIAPPGTTIEPHGVDSIKLTWEQTQYNYLYTIKDHNNYTTNTYIERSPYNVAYIPAPPFAGEYTYKIIFDPEIATTCQQESPDYEYRSFVKYFSGSIMPPNDGLFHPMSLPSPFHYYEAGNVLLLRHQNAVVLMDINSYLIKKKHHINDFQNNGLISQSKGTTNIALAMSDVIHIYENEHFANPKIYAFDNQGSITHLSLKDNNKLIFVQNNICKYLDLESEEVRDLFTTHENNTIASSADGKYVIHSRWKEGFRIYKIEESSISIIHEEVGRWLNRSPQFNPDKPDEVFISFENYKRLEIRSLPDFKQMGSVLFESSVYIKNIDPFTGYLLVTTTSNTPEPNKMHIVDIDKKEILLSIRNEDPDVRLFNNRIVTNLGFYLDVTEFLP